MKDSWDELCTIVDFDIIQCREQSTRSERDVFNAWPDGLIRFSFEKLPDRIASGSFSISKTEAKERISAQFPSFPMLTFKEVPSAAADLHFRMPTDPKLCSANVGYQVNAHVNLGASAFCWSDATILHELGHVAGLKHTQNRDDRDEYIKFSTTFPTFSGALFFDFRSIMLYPLDLLSATLTTKGRTRMALQNIEEDQVGHVDTLSRIDLETLALHYGDAKVAPETNDDSLPFLALLWVLAGVSVLLVVAAILRHRRKKPTYQPSIL